MRRLMLYIIVVALAVSGHATSAFAEDILVLMSIKTSGNQEMLTSAMSACGNSSIKYINLAENAEINLPQVVRSLRSKVVLTTGDKAYKMASLSLSKTPVIGALTTDQKANAISFNAPPEKYLASMRKMGCKNVTVIYSDHSAAYIRKATELAKNYGITLIRREVSSPFEAIDQFVSLKVQTDALWMLPDINILTAGSAEILMRTAQERNIPVFTFSRNYLRNGAAVVVEVDRVQVGKVVGEGVCSIIDGTSTGLQQKDVYREYTNDTVLDRLKLHKNRM